MICGNIIAVYSEAVRLTSFYTVKDTFLAGLDSAPGLNPPLKTAIRLAAEKLPLYPDSGPGARDGVLRGIMLMTWPEVGVPDGEADALSMEQREGILQGVLAACRLIIDAERARLADVMALDTTMPSTALE